MPIERVDITKKSGARSDLPERAPSEYEWPEGIDWRDVYHDVIDWGMFIRNHRVYMKRVKKGGKDEEDTYWFKDITNFSIEIALHMKDDLTSSYLLNMHNVHGRKERVDCNTDDTVGVQGFKKLLRRIGNFDFTGTAGDFDKLWSYLQEHMGSGIAIRELGWQKRGRFFAFVNAAVNGTVTEYDKYGCFEVDMPDGTKQQYYVPAGNSLHRDNDTAYESSKLIQLIDSDITFEAWASLMHKVHRQHSMSAICFGLATVFSDFIHSVESGFPMLFFYGEASTGKGELVRCVQTLFGKPQPQITLTGKANTDKGKLRMFAEHNGIPLYLDEYRNSLPEEMFEMLKSIWDRTGYKRGNITTRYGTDTVPIRCTAFLSGNYYPNADDALLTRLVVEEMDAPPQTAESKRNFRMLTDLRDRGYSGILVNILKHRDRFEKEWKSHYEQVRGDIDTRIGLKITQDRMLKNIGILCATYQFFAKNQILTFPFTYNQLLEHLVKVTLSQEDKRDQGNDVAHFWDCFLKACKDKKLVNDEHWKMEGDTLYVFWKDVHLEYLQYHYQLYRANSQSNTNILNKLKKNPYFAGVKDSTWIGDKKSSAYMFKMSAINGFDLAGLLVKRVNPGKGKEKDEPVAAEVEEEPF
jgi:hypothetical protein